MSTEGGTRAVIAALLANLGIAATKFIAFFLTGFSSMLAEAIHSVADSGNQILLLIGGKRSQREATPQHPFGFGRERYVYSFIVSIVLFTLGGCFALYEAWHKFEETRGDERLRPVRVALVVGAGRRARSSRSAWRASASAPPCASRTSCAARARGCGSCAARRHPSCPSSCSRTSARSIGLTLALLGVGLMLLTGNPIFDVLGSASIGVLLVIIAAFLAVEMKSLLVGESATTAHQKAILEALASPEAIERVIHSKTLHLGPEELLVAAKLAVAPTERAVDVAAAIDEAERRARDAVPELTLRHVPRAGRRPGRRLRPRRAAGAAGTGSALTAAARCRAATPPAGATARRSETGPGGRSRA